VCFTTVLVMCPLSVAPCRCHSTCPRLACHQLLIWTTLATLHAKTTLDLGCLSSHTFLLQTVEDNWSPNKGAFLVHLAKDNGRETEVCHSITIHVVCLSLHIVIGSHACGRRLRRTQRANLVLILDHARTGGHCCRCNNGRLVAGRGTWWSPVRSWH
jgi:hypothetical protein